jgi:predicted nucleic acid-binding protein
MLIVDSSVWIDALFGVTNRHTNWLRRAIGREEIGLTSLSLCEILQGVRSDVRFRSFRRDLLQFPVFDTVSADLAVMAARNYRLLRGRGITVRKTIDCLIATFCIRDEHILLHNDRDFDGFAMHLGLRVVDLSTGFPN